jgi:DNA topoisomerase-2
LTRSIFLLKDDAVLDYVSDDGTSVEPLHYAPIVPFVLVNGSCGIGTGSSTEILSYNPLTIMDYLEAKLTNAVATLSFVPYYQGFQGSIQKISAETDPDKWLVKGCYHKVGVDTIVVTELPIGFWTQDCKNLLEELLVNEKNKEKNEKAKEKVKEKKENTKENAKAKEKEKTNTKEVPAVIKDFKENHTDTTVCFTITFAPGKLEEYENMTNAFNINGIEKLLKLTTTLSTSNMHLYDEKGVLTKYATVTDIIDHYCKVRLEIYAKRKTHVIQDLERKLMVLSNKTKYMDELLAEPPTIDLRKKKTEEINALLQAKQYDQLADNYNYLVKMPMDSVSEEQLSKLRKQFDAMRDELQQTKDTSPTDFWLQELHMLRTKYTEYMLKRKEELDLELELEKNTVKQMNVNKTVKKVKQCK